MATIQLNTFNLDENIKNLVNTGEVLKIENTTYTTKIKLKNGNSYLFAKGKINKSTFIAHSKIKKDLKNNKIKMFTFDKKINYFDFNENIKYQKELICIDINGAYPKEMLNKKYINKNTYDYLINNIDKIDRLKSLGMLATNKIIQEIENKKIKKIYLEEKETACIFFDVSYKIGDIFNDLFYKYPNYIFFYWVDGIFCKPEIKEIICEELKNNNFDYSIEQVKNLENKKKYITFDKENYKKGIFEKKIIFKPQKQERVSQKVWDFLNK